MNTQKSTSLFIFLVILGFISLTCRSCKEGSSDQWDIIIIGGGASGVMAAIQAARLDKKVLVVEETEWLGGMFTSAGVSAIDGNYGLASGLWEEFRQRISNYYGGPEEVKTGWVSNVLFEPHIAAAILDSMVLEEENIQVMKESLVNRVSREGSGWKVSIQSEIAFDDIYGKILIDATELGDIAAMLNIPYDIGMDSRYDTDEDIAPEEANDIIQDLTYVAVLEQFDRAEDARIEKPEGYDPEIFRCTCAGYCDQDSIGRTLWPCDQMMEYGKLPNNKIMINWPIYGNDYYVNAIEMTRDERMKAFEKAKNFTRSYVYYLQNELGFDDWGIAKSIFPTEDGFPMIPYHRESRRIQGMVRFDVNDLADPYGQEDPLYRTGIAVGDYPVDHHHAAYPEAHKLPDLHFYPVPSYALPLGTLIPKDSEGLIVAEKSISVTNIVNGTTRLQPVCMLIGQAAGTLAALSVETGKDVSEVPVRDVQRSLLASNVFILPYADVAVDEPEWAAIQRIGATGLLEGEGKNIGWRNYTFFHPDTMVSNQEIIENLESFGFTLTSDLPQEEWVTTSNLLAMLSPSIASDQNDYVVSRLQNLWVHLDWESINPDKPLKRREVAVLLDFLLNPFARNIDHHGKFEEDLVPIEFNQN